jgi:dTDP-4-amino-4,6-dideoxygalactose transaminase
MSSGMVALEIAFRALGLSGEVIIPSFTFIATAHSLQWQEISPVFCDIDTDTHTIDPAKAEELITPRTSNLVGSFKNYRATHSYFQIRSCSSFFSSSSR